MIKKLLLAVLIALPMCISAQAVKFGTVNSQQIFEIMPEKANAEKTLVEVSKKYEDEFKKLQDEFNKKYTEFQALDAATPQSIKDRRMQELQENQTKIQNFQQMASSDLQKQQEALLAPISEKLQQAIKAVGQENAFTFVFDLSIPSVVYSGAPAQDITALVKAKLGLK
ncbi:MAG: OmpH family outer membrane protein [Muribaculaceae bacterium]|nr:OmpH family outer membrane protein [Muribaculaceae bacterium]